MSDVAWLDSSAHGAANYVGLTRLARKAAARGESLEGAGSARLYLHPFTPYVYRGTGRDELTPWMDDEPDDAPAPARGCKSSLPCGTPAAARRHRRRGDIPPGKTLRDACRACADAEHDARYKPELAGRRP